MGPQSFFGEYFWIFPLVMMVLCFIVFKSGFMKKRPPGFNRGNTLGVPDQKDLVETPLDILKKRYAKGEISKRQFEEMKKDL
jgi:putative membrane protein